MTTKYEENIWNQERENTRRMDMDFAYRMCFSQKQSDAETPVGKTSVYW
jgi:hypothetical protein